MNYSPGGYNQPPENNNPYVNFGPKMPHFVPVEVWLAEKNNIKKLSIFAAISILVYIIGSGVFVSIIQTAASLLSELEGFDYAAFYSKFNSAEFQYLYSALYSVLIVGGPFFLLGFLFRKKGVVADIPMGRPLNSKNFPLIIFGCFGVCLASNLITSYLTLVFSSVSGIELGMPEMPETPHSVGGILLFFLSTAVVPALIEEMAIRGVIMQPLRRYGDWFAIIASAMVFGIMHCNLMQIPFAFTAGIVIGYAVIVTESVWTGVIIHFLNNAFSVTVSIITDFYGETSVQSVILNIIFYAVVIAGCICAVNFYRFKNKKTFYKSPLVNSGNGFFGNVPPFSAKISIGTLLKSYFLTLPMIVAFGAVVYETIMAIILLQ
ncbi:MAG: CPBP family intramembrane metalloprotease [Clostridia bacterium]|nr:CPBP family intramembrane metalloprotease [Clostridia bacterium]